MIKLNPDSTFNNNKYSAKYGPSAINPIDSRVRFRSAEIFMNAFGKDISHIIITQFTTIPMTPKNAHKRPPMASRSTQTPETFPTLSPHTHSPQGPLPLPVPPQALKESASPSIPAKRRYKKKSGSYYWSQCQNRLYAEAVQRYSEILQMDTKEKRLRKVNVLISRVVRKRSPLQCHTHHQKMLAKYGSLQKIVQEILSDGGKKEKVVLREEAEEWEQKDPQGSPMEESQLLPQLDWEQASTFRPPAAMHGEEFSLDIFFLSEMEIEMRNYENFIDVRMQEASGREEMIELDFWA